MECDDAEYSGAVNLSADEESRIAAVNSTILDYYKKFGRKRDLEQYFSLSTAQSEIRDPTSLFWRRMKAQNESSDSGERSSTELCRISIKCSVADPEPSCSQDDNPKTKSDSESPPIITEDVAHDSSVHSDDESIKSDDNRSLKSVDVTLDTSMNKPFSPTSSITSQRKLEWDSLADVGYANETDRKTSASSLSTLERLALLQHYSNNDTKSDLGLPTAHSTPLDENESKSKGKKGVGKVTKIYRKDVDCVEVNVPYGSELNPGQAINVNLTKHISFNVDGGVTIDNVNKDVSVTPEKVSVQTEVKPLIKSDKEIQTTLTKEKSSSSGEILKTGQLYGQKVPVLINLNTLKKRNRRKIRMVRKRVRSRNKICANKENLPILEKSGDQVSEAESFEYMPGHIYNQNQRNNEPSTTAGNKSSLESSAQTTDSSKNTQHSFTKDLEKSIKLLKAAMQKRYNDSDLKKILVKEVIQRLLKSSYRDEESSTEFLSGLSFSSKKLGLGESNTTTSTSDANNTYDKSIKPKKSILRVDKFNANAIFSTSQSAPNLPSVSNSEKPVASNLRKPSMSSNTDSDVSSREKNSSDPAFAKTSSEELYQKYIDALRREEAYKKHLRDKENFLKQKLVRSESALKVPARLDVKSQTRLKNLMKDLTRNNYDDGSGDASKLEGGPNNNTDFIRPNLMRSQKSHSVFTLSSGNSDCQSRKSNLKRSEVKDSPKAGCSKEQQHYCCCPFHSTNTKIGLIDSSVQVNLKERNKEDPRVQQVHQAGLPCKGSCNGPMPMNIARVVSDDTTGDIKYVCLCKNKDDDLQKLNDNFLIYKCSRLPSQGIQSEELRSNTVSVQCKTDCAQSRLTNETCGTSTSLPAEIRCLRMECKNLYGIPEISSKSSQTNIVSQITCNCNTNEKDKDNIVVHEVVRCLQTEISINPKISDPSLSDINIVSDTDCARLIKEQYRVVSKSSSQSSATNQKINIAPLCMSDKISQENLNKCECGKTKLDKEIQSENEHANDEIISKSCYISEVEDKYRIPIQGTNMTLMVSIGSNATKTGFEMPRNELRTQAMVTDAINTNENATCLRDECSKGVQSTNEMDQNTGSCSPLVNPCREESLINTLFAKEEFYDNIYPSEDIQLNEVNPTCDANTGSSEKGCGIQTQLMDNFLSTQSEIRSCHKPENTEPSECSTYPKVKCVQKPFLRSDTANVEKIITSRYKDPATSKCCCPESARCEHSCGEDFDCAHQRVFPREKETSNNEDKNQRSTRSNSEETVKDTCGPKNQSPRNKSKCSCLETAKCEGNCGPDFDCVNQRPFLRSDPNRDNKKSDRDSCDLDKSTKNKNKCSCPETAKCKGNCGPDFDCLNQRTFSRSDPERDNKKSDKDSCASGQSTKNKNKCNCPETAKCKGNCGPDFDCKNQRLFPRSDSDRDSSKSEKGSSSISNDRSIQKNTDCMSQKPSPRFNYDKTEKESCSSDDRNIQKKSNKCSCPETAKCKGDCGENFDCANQRPFHCSDFDKIMKESCDSSHSKKKDKCGCPDSAKCKGNCGPDFDCVNKKPFPSRKAEKEPSSVPRKKIEESSSSANERKNKKKSKCSCPESARCKGECGENFGCVNKRPILRTNTDRGDSEYNSLSDREIIDDTINKILEENRCGCLESTKCGGTCPENADCRKNFEMQLDLKDGRRVIHSNSTKGKQCYIQTDYVDIETKETQKGYNTDYSQSGKSQCYEPESSNTETKGRPSSEEQSSSKQNSSETDSRQIGNSKDLVLDIIQDITKRYSKKDIEKSQRKKCFNEIMTILKYLLDTEDSIDSDTIQALKKDLRLKSDSDCDPNVLDLPSCQVQSTSRKNEENINIKRSRKEPSCSIYSYSHSKRPEKIQIIETPDTYCRTESKPQEQPTGCGQNKVLVDKAVQLTTKKSKSSKVCTESSDVPVSTDCRGTSSDSATCKVLSKIKKECEKYQKRCKCHSSKRCEGSSSTSVNCDQCKRVHYCHCRGHKCKIYRPKSSVEKVKKKCVAYNLIIQTSESMISEETACNCNNKPLQNIIVKVPKRNNVQNVPFKEVAAKIERQLPCCSPRSECRTHRSRSLPNKNGSNDCIEKSNVFTVRDYLERNRPDFVEQCSMRQGCLKMIGEKRTQECGPPELKMLVVHPPNYNGCVDPCNMYCGGNVEMSYNPCADPCVKTEVTRVANERPSYRELLSLQLQLDGQPSLNDLSDSDLRRLAKELGVDPRRRPTAPKFISERDMKKHSEKIYKSLPEVVQKKEELKKEGVKKTNLLMANMFKKNLQKKTLRGSVNLSNYNTILKI